MVNPGDAVIADVSGALALPAGEAEADVDWALGKQQAEPAAHEKLLAGARLGDLSGASAMTCTDEISNLCLAGFFNSASSHAHCSSPSMVFSGSASGRYRSLPRAPRSSVFFNGDRK